MTGARKLRVGLVVFAVALLLMGRQTAVARIKLVTLPVRERVV